MQCLAGDGRQRFRFRPKQEKVIAPSNTWLHKNSAQRVWVVDAAGQPGKTIVVSTGDQCVHGLNANGERQWLASSRPGIASVLATSDVDGDGRPEMLVGNRDICNIGILWILNGKDRPLAEFDPRTGDTINAVVAADLDGDGREEVLVATQALACLDPRTDEGPLGACLWRRGPRRCCGARFGRRMRWSWPHRAMNSSWRSTRPDAASGPPTRACRSSSSSPCGAATTVLLAAVGADRPRGRARHRRTGALSI